MLLVAGWALAAASACGGNGDVSADAAQHEAAHAVTLHPVPDDRTDVTDPRHEPGPAGSNADQSQRETSGDDVAVVGEHGHLGSLTDAVVDDVWLKWRARPSLDRSTAVMTFPDELARTLDQTHIAWVSLPDAVEIGEVTLTGSGELNAVSQSGDLIALTNFAESQKPDEIAGAKSSTRLVIADRTGIRYETRLDGNFVAEAFGRAVGADGLPDQVFLLEHIPADAPRFYRVRVLSTETGEVSLPLNIRDKSQHVDERMSGLSRSQVIADEHGLIFTLYRGTIDGDPDGEPYAFVHTLDLANGVWCLFIDPALELDTLPGSIAVGGDRLFVASANGHVGSIRIPSITDLGRNPEMDWAVRAGHPSDQPPVLLADADGAWIGLRDGSEQLIRVDNEGRVQQPHEIPGSRPTALALDDAGQIIAAGDHWSTHGDPALPEWFGAPVVIIAD